DERIETPDSGAAPASALTDDALLAKIRQSAQRDKFEALWAGDINGYTSQSEADQALCDILAWWTQSDAVRIDRLFRTSKLYREKWNRSDYRDRTIKQAIAAVQGGYQLPRVSRERADE